MNLSRGQEYERQFENRNKNSYREHINEQIKKLTFHPFFSTAQFIDTRNKFDQQASSPFLILSHVF